MGLIGIVAGLVMLRWGILATLTWHYTVDAFLTGLSLMRAGDLYSRDIRHGCWACGASFPWESRACCMRREADSRTRRRCSIALRRWWNIPQPLNQQATAEPAASYAPLTARALGVLALGAALGIVLLVAVKPAGDWRLRPISAGRAAGGTGIASGVLQGVNVDPAHLSPCGNRAVHVRSAGKRISAAQRGHRGRETHLSRYRAVGVLDGALFSRFAKRRIPRRAVARRRVACGAPHPGGGRARRESDQRRRAGKGGSSFCATPRNSISRSGSWSSRNPISCPPAPTIRLRGSKSPRWAHPSRHPAARARALHPVDVHKPMLVLQVMRVPRRTQARRKTRDRQFPRARTRA